MQEKIKNFLNDYIQKWNSLEKQQKIRLLLSIVSVVVALILTIYIVTKPKMSALYTNKDASTITQIKAALDDANIKNNIIQGGRGIEVKEKDVAEALMIVEGNNNIFVSKSFLPKDMLDNISMSTSEKTRCELSRYALQGTIEEALKGLDGIEDATVLLNLPEKNGLILKDKQMSTASVYLTTSKPFDSDRALSIATSVAGAVDGLTIENINITDQRGQTIFSGSNKDQETGNKNFELEKQRKNEIENSVFLLLKPMFDDVKITSSIKINNDKITESEKVVTNPLGNDINKGLVSKETKLSETAEGGSVGGEPGLSSNNNTTNNYETGSQSNTSASRDESKYDYIYDWKETHKELGLGTVLNESSSLAIIVYNYKVYDEKYMTTNNLLNGLTWAQFKEANANSVPIQIDKELVNNLIIGTNIKNLSLLGYEIPVFKDFIKPSMNWTEITLFIILALFILMLAYGLIKRTKSEEVVEVEPELSVEDLLVSTRLEEEKEIEAEKLREIDYSVDSEAKKQIDKFVTDKPEAVAQLLRNWINDGWE